MKRFKALVAVMVLVGLTGLDVANLPPFDDHAQAFAQTPVQQVLPDVTAANKCLSVSGSGAQTLTIPSPGGTSSIYLKSVILYGEATGTVTAAAPIAITTTGLSGTPSLGSVNLTAWTIGALTGPGPINFPGSGLKGTAGSAVTIAAASVTNISWRFTACWFEGP
jgi:hypothetical protein